MVINRLLPSRLCFQLVVWVTAVVSHGADFSTGGGSLRDDDFRADCISCWNRKRDFVADSDILRKKTGQQKLGLIGEHTGRMLLLPLHADHALPADGNGRVEGRKNHAVGGQYRTALRKLKTPLSESHVITSIVRLAIPYLYDVWRADPLRGPPCERAAI